MNKSMNIIYPTRIYIKKISYISNIDITISQYPPIHTHVLSPIEVSYDSNATYLHYLVSDRGMTLREFIGYINRPNRKVRRTVFNSFHHNYQVDIILQLIDAYDFMMTNNMLVGQPNINPDCIWIERNLSGEIKVYVMDVLETIIHDRYRITDDNQQYWSSEYINEYHNINYYNIDYQYKPILTRCDTRLPCKNIVYSLALILYFIVEHKDPYPEGRVIPVDRPYFSADCNAKYKTYIMFATEPNIIKRPSLNEWKRILKKHNATHRCIVC